MVAGLPEELIARFRTLSFERLERIDAAWIALTKGQATVQIEQEVFRDLHTLKGDARVVGFDDVAVLCQRVEDLLFASRDRNYRVHEDVDIVLTMALQFIGMLLRKKKGGGRTGIDLDGFLKQIEEVVTEWLRRSSESPDQGVHAPHLRVGESRQRFTQGACERLSAASTAVYLEHLRAIGPARARLRGVWESMVHELREISTLPLRPWLEQQAAAATELAHELGKKVEVKVEIASDVAASSQVLDAIGTAVVHTLGNAVDHGIETPAQRQRANKPQTGTITLHVAVAHDLIHLVITDDGGGIDTTAVKLRAVDDGILAPDAAAQTSDAEVEAIVFRAGFTTRPVATDVSGRGIGLDAARAALERVGGTMTLASSAGAGVRVSIAAPRVRTVSSVHAFPSARGRYRFAIPSTWSLCEPGTSWLDPELVLELSSEPTTSAARVVWLKRNEVEVGILCGAAPTIVMADRLCPNAENDDAEVVRIESDEVILIRPNILARRVS